MSVDGMNEDRKVWLGYDQSALDNEYNNQRTVGDYGAVIREWTTASDEAREGGVSHPDVAYGEDLRSRLDIYSTPAGGGCIVFFHGGFWRSFDKASLAFLAPAFNAVGLSIALPNYPLAPEADMRRIVQNAIEAVEWVAERAGEFKFDPSKLWVGGHSAGAHLALMAALSPKLRGKIAGCCAISGVYDLEPIRLSYLNESLNLTVEDVDAYSPIRRLAPDLHLIAAVGGDETQEFCRQAADLVRQCRAMGVHCDSIVLPETDHYETVRSLGRPGSPILASLSRAMDGSSVA
jgi:arylformamidase